MYPNNDFWSENKPSGNPALDAGMFSRNNPASGGYFFVQQSPFVF
jgi:hypothetical protein